MDELYRKVMRVYYNAVNALLSENDSEVPRKDIEKIIDAIETFAILFLPRELYIDMQLLKEFAHHEAWAVIFDEELEELKKLLEKYGIESGGGSNEESAS